MLLTHATVATMTSKAGSGGYGLIPDAAVALEGDRIIWAGPMAELPAACRALPRKWRIWNAPSFHGPKTRIRGMGRP